jgi:hypothetical protein
MRGEESEAGVQSCVMLAMAGVMRAGPRIGGRILSRARIARTLQPYELRELDSGSV